MRAGLGISIGFHVAIVAAAAIGLPNGRLIEPDPIEAMPVELVPIAELTDLQLGDRKAKPIEAPDRSPQPKPTVKAETEQPSQEKKAAKVPVKAVKEPSPAPIVEDVKTPDAPVEKQIAAITPPEATPAPEPEPQKPVEALAPAPKPKVRPKPPKRVERPKVQTAKKPEKRELTFNSDEISALLNKRDPAGGGSPDPSNEPQTTGSNEGKPKAAMTQDEIAALKARLYQCWNPPRGVREARNLTVRVSINLNPDGSLSGAPRIVGGGIDSLSQIAAESAVRAVQICAPYDILPAEKYQVWRSINFTFDPSQMLGG